MYLRVVRATQGGESNGRPVWSSGGSMTAGGVRFARKKGGWTNLTALKRPFPSFSLIPSFVSAVRWLDLNGGRRTPGHDDPPPRRGAGSSRAAFFRRSRCGPKWVRCDGVEIKDIVLYYIIVSYCYTIYISIYIYINIYVIYITFGCGIQPSVPPLTHSVEVQTQIPSVREIYPKHYMALAWL